MSDGVQGGAQRLRVEELRQTSRYTHVAGGGRVEWQAGGARLINPAGDDSTYHNAQLDDYRLLSRKQFAWRAPVRLQVRARFSHGADTLRGTAGFGFWNDPFLMTTRRMPTLPRALWFFYASPPSNMALAHGVPGHGWKAAVIDAQRPAFFALAPTAPLALPLMHAPWLYDRLWPVAQRALGVNEMLLDAEMRDWHDYCIEWSDRSVRFLVDDQLVLCATPAPRGPLGFVLWLDNQSMIVTPQGKVRHQLLTRTAAQALEIEALTVSQI